MAIRDYKSSDWPQVQKLHADSGLPENCLADASDPLFLIRRVVTDASGQMVMAAFVRITSEPFILLDHGWSSPTARWRMLKELTEDVCRIARERGLEQLTCFVPPAIEASFAKRLESLGFVRSPWQSYTRNL